LAREVAMSTPEQRMRRAKQIVDFEASRDKKGHLQVYKLPAGTESAATRWLVSTRTTRKSATIWWS
jgi:hypothetical protein